MQPDTWLRNAGSYDYVVVGGLIGDRSAIGSEAEAYIKAAAAGVSLVGLCTGVFILQETGVLQGYRCCVSWFHHQDFLDRFDTETPVSDQLFVIDRDRLTCSVGHGAAHLAAFLVQRHIGRSPQKIYIELRIDRAVTRLGATDESITAIALACGFCDAPHLVRTMKAERGLTPAEYRRRHSDRPR